MYKFGIDNPNKNGHQTRTLLNPFALRSNETGMTSKDIISSPMCKLPRSMEDKSKAVKRHKKAKAKGKGGHPSTHISDLLCVYFFSIVCQRRPNGAVGAANYFMLHISTLTLYSLRVQTPYIPFHTWVPLFSIISSQLAFPYRDHRFLITFLTINFTLRFWNWYSSNVLINQFSLMNFKTLSPSL